MKLSSFIGNITQIATRLHSDLQSIGADDHHAKQHALNAGADHTGAIDLAQAGVGVSRIASGSYTGNNTANRAIPHGLGRTPIFVRIFESSLMTLAFVELGGLGRITYSWTAGYNVTAPDATNFYVGNAGSYPNSANSNTVVYYWVAFG